MTAHFNFALAKATGEYVSIIGADDGVMPYFSLAMSQLIHRFPEADAFLAPRAYFFWPGVSDQYGGRSVLLHGRRGHRAVDPNREYQAALRGRINYADSLQMYAGSVITRRLIERVLSADPAGIFYRGTQPDMYSTFTLLSHMPKVMRTGYPLHWTGSSPASNGYQHATASANEARTKDFWELADASDDATTAEFDHGRETPVPLLVVDAAIRARRVHPLAGSRELTHLELESALVGAFARSRPDQRPMVMETAQRLSPAVDLSRVRTSVRELQIKAARLRLALDRRLAGLGSGMLIERSHGRSDACLTVSEADNAVIQSGFTPG